MPGSVVSLWVRLIIGLVAVSVLAVTAASALLYVRFKSTNSQFRERTLQQQARVISKVLRRTGEGQALQLNDISLGFQDGKGRFAIVSEAGELVAGSTGVKAPLAPVVEGSPREYFLLEGKGNEPTYYGISIPASFAHKAVWVQVAFVSSDIVFDSVLEEFLKDIAWIWGPFVVLFLIVNLAVARIGLRPLRRAARKVEEIGPGDVTTRIPEEGLPLEVLALARGVNRAFDRLQAAIGSQKAFIADAAHELRTPVAVLKAHVAVLPEFAGIDALKEEVNSIGRLVEQLLDSARLDAVVIDPGAQVELGELARRVATALAPLAIARDRSIEVEAGDAPTLVRGSDDHLERAVRNLVENAIEHTAPATMVTIVVKPPGTLVVSDRGPGIKPEMRAAIFKRFWQARAKSSGAGLGLDIVARTVAAHGGTVEVLDRPGGGASFVIRLTPATPPGGRGRYGE